MIHTLPALILATHTPDTDGVGSHALNQREVANVNMVETVTVKIGSVGERRRETDGSRLITHAAQTEQAVLVEWVG